MPRKLSYNIDYDDIWDEEDDYADEEYLEEEDHSKSYDQTKAHHPSINAAAELLKQGHSNLDAEICDEDSMRCYAF
ncbi:hypothetical protein QQ045_016196 [Rhodiola kirilowii]